MKNGKKIVAIITARSGSKGVPDKNIKELNGKPMMAYSIESAVQSGIFDRIIVSTDSEKYAEIAKAYGATVMGLRPPELSQDDTKSVDALLYELQKLEENGECFDCFMLLQPTSPLRTVKNIIESVDLFFEKDAYSILGVREVDHPPEWSCPLDETLDLTILQKQIKATRRQDSPKYYQLNGAIYFVDCNHFRESKSLFDEKAFAYVMEKRESIDVDDIYDFMLVDVILKQKENENNEK